MVEMKVEDLKEQDFPRSPKCEPFCGDGQLILTCSALALSNLVSNIPLLHKVSITKLTPVAVFFLTFPR